MWENEEEVTKHLHKQVNDFLNGKININEIKKILRGLITPALIMQEINRKISCKSAK